MVVSYAEEMLPPHFWTRPGLPVHTHSLPVSVYLISAGVIVVEIWPSMA
jgi:hypothetical protein